MDERRLERVIVCAAEGDEDAWAELCDHTERLLAKVIAHPRFLNRVGQRESDRRNILVEVVARLYEDNFHRLKLYLEAKQQTPQLRFKTWLRILAKKAGIDYVLGETANGTSRGGSGASELLRHAAGTVPEPQLSALELWVQSASYDEIARELELSGSEEAKQLVNMATDILRRHVREAGGQHD